MFSGTFQNVDNTEAVLDLGGGSTQITSVANEQVSQSGNSFNSLETGDCCGNVYGYLFMSYYLLPVTRIDFF